MVDDRLGWESHVTTDEYAETRACSETVDLEVAGIDELPAPVFADILPAGTYAVFALRGAEMATKRGDAIQQQWLPASNYEESIGGPLERYDQEGFRGWG